VLHCSNSVLHLRIGKARRPTAADLSLRSATSGKRVWMAAGPAAPKLGCLALLVAVL